MRSGTATGDFVHSCATECGAPTHAVLCRTCRDGLVAALRDLAYGTRSDGREIAGLWDALQDAVTGQTRGRGTVGGKSSSTPLPFNEQASKVATALENVIGTWARSFADENPHLTPAYRSIPEACVWLASFPGLLASSPEAGLMHAEITGAAATVRRALGWNADRLFLGICSESTEDGPCEADVYGQPDRATAKCQACGAVHDVGKRREVLRAAVDEQTLTAIDLSRIAPFLLERELSVNSIRNWAMRGELVSAGRDDAGRPKYRVSDVVALAATKRTRRRKGQPHSTEQVA